MLIFEEREREEFEWKYIVLRYPLSDDSTALEILLSLYFQVVKWKFQESFNAQLK